MGTGDKQMNTAPGQRLLGYARVSRDSASNPIENQVRALRACGVADGADIYRDTGVSRTVPTAERPGWQALMRAAQSGDTIIAWDIDRIFGSPLDYLLTLQALAERRVLLREVVNPAFCPERDEDSKLIGLMKVAFSEQEIIKAARRSTSARQKRAANGEHIGRRFSVTRGQAERIHDDRIRNPDWTYAQLSNVNGVSEHVIKRVLSIDPNTKPDSAFRQMGGR